VSAFISVQPDAHGHPPGGPTQAVFIIPQVKAAPAHVKRRVVIAVARNPAQAGVFIEAVTTACVAYQTIKIPAAQIVYPGQGCIRSGDYVLPGLVIKITVTHFLSFAFRHSAGIPPAGFYFPAARFKKIINGNQPKTIQK